MAKVTKNITPDPLVYMASMYAEYCYLDHTFIQKHQCLFGVKAELYDMVRAEIDRYEGAWHLYWAACKKYCVPYQKKNSGTNLLDWGELLYGEVRFDSSTERKQYRIKPYNPYKKRK